MRLAVQTFGGVALVAAVAFGAVAANVPPTEPASSSTATIVDPFFNREVFLTLAVIFFGVVVVLIQYLLLRPVVRDRTNEISRTFIVSLIIIGTLALITSGYDSSQIAPALGLFGTIAGYLLGKSDRRDDRGNRDKA
jgi:predicted MFS family arabinose efflux permease